MLVDIMCVCLIVVKLLSTVCANQLSIRPPNLTNKRKIPEDTLCPVCCDTVSGIHYGVYTCESCKSFFKRAVTDNKFIMYKCALSSECPISRNSRFCQFCRFKKCVNIGMNVSLVRLTKVRGGRVKICLNKN